jgi:hypothetical protein
MNLLFCLVYHTQKLQAIWDNAQSLWYRGFSIRKSENFSFKILIYPFFPFLSTPARGECGRVGGICECIQAVPTTDPWIRKENWPWSEYMLRGSGQYFTSEGQVGNTTWTSRIILSYWGDPLHRYWGLGNILDPRLSEIILLMISYLLLRGTGWYHLLDLLDRYQHWHDPLNLWLRIGTCIWPETHWDHRMTTLWLRLRYLYLVTQPDDLLDIW